MIIARIELNGNTQTNIYDKWEDFHHDIFNPECEYEFVELGRLRGKTYQERKADIEDKAITYSHLMSDLVVSYGLLAMINNYFEKYGKRYGLLQVFRENAIC